MRLDTDSERGTVMMEVVLVTLPLVLVLSFLVLAGRTSSAEGDVSASVRTAARTAALRRLPADAKAQGEAAGVQLLASSTACSDGGVTVDVTDWGDGIVIATGWCQVNPRGLLVGAQRLNASWTEPIALSVRIDNGS